MGTETGLPNLFRPSNFQKGVKLNNPPMGTETFPQFLPLLLVDSFELVKLNNPLMGTETRQMGIYLSQFLHGLFKLNNPH